MKNATLVGTMNSVPLGFSYLFLKESSRFALTFFGGVTSIFSTLVRVEPWGQTTASLLSPEGLLIKITYTA